MHKSLHAPYYYPIRTSLTTKSIIRNSPPRLFPHSIQPSPLPTECDFDNQTVLLHPLIHPALHWYSRHGLSPMARHRSSLQSIIWHLFLGKNQTLINESVHSIAYTPPVNFGPPYEHSRVSSILSYWFSASSLLGTGTVQPVCSDASEEGGMNTCPWERAPQCCRCSAGALLR